MISFTEPRFNEENAAVFSELVAYGTLRQNYEFFMVNLKLIVAEHKEAKYTRKAQEQAEKRKRLVLTRSVKIITTLTFKFR